MSTQVPRKLITALRLASELKEARERIADLEADLAGWKRAASLFARCLAVGTPVYLRITDTQRLATRTRSEAWQLGDGSWVVLVDGKMGGWSLDFLEPRTEGEP